jgi:hypothetical protein
VAASLRPPRRKRPFRPTTAFALPSHWSPAQALAVFECLELLRDQLWLAYGPEIQRAWRDQLAPQQLTLPIDPSDPF